MLYVAPTKRAKIWPECYKHVAPPSKRHQEADAPAEQRQETHCKN